MHQIKVPSYLDIGEAVLFFEESINGILYSNTEEVCFDFTSIFFIKPAGVVTLWNLVDYVNRVLKKKVYYQIPHGYRENPRNYPAVDYLDDCLFFEKVMGKKQHEGSRPRSTTNGLEKLEHGKYNQSYIRNTILWLKSNATLRTKSLGTLEIALGEVFNNINDHSGSFVGGCAFAQHFPAKNSISFCIADAGIGIPNKIRTKFQTDEQGNSLWNDSSAMRFAIKAKVTTESTPSNRGMGLDNLITIIEANGGSLSILSNQSKLSYNKVNKLQVIDQECSYQGTLFMMNFKTNTLDIEEEEDFEW